MQPYKIQHLENFDPDPQYFTRPNNIKLIEDIIQLSPDQLDGVLFGFFIETGDFNENNTYLKIFDQFNTRIPLDGPLNRFVGQIMDNDTNDMDVDYYALIRYIWDRYPNRPNTLYYLILVFPRDNYTKYSAWGFNNPEFLQGILTSCQWLNTDCRQNLKLLDQNGNHLEF